ncbi:MAG: 3-isopropylmalate dehydratase small subunit [bacterium]
MKGKVFKYGDNVDTDQIYPGRYLELTDPENIASHALEGLDSDFTDKVKKGDIIAGGKNFGCGSSREHAVICLKESGVGAIVAESFARIFYRNAINMGLPLIEVSDLKLETGDVLTIKLEKGVIEKENKIIKEFKKLPENILDIIKSGGVINYYLHKNQ